MFPTPKGYISIPDAVDRVVRALHGGSETIPWRGNRLDRAVLPSGREHTTEAEELLIAELSAGRLVAEIGDVELPAEYWTCNGAHTTAHTGCLEPPEISAGDYAELAYRPCFIELGVFEKWLLKIGGRGRGRKPGAGKIDDSAHYKKMNSLWKSGKAKSINDAARIVVQEQPLLSKHAEPKSVQRRLAKGYRDTYG